jgi:mono/diheme cytochrome c family protein
MEAEEGGRRVDTGGNEAADALGGTGRQAEERLRRPGADRTWTADASAGTGLRADERLRQGGGGKRAAGASAGRSRRGGRGLDGGRAALVGARLNGAIAGAGLGLLVLAGAATASAAPAVTDFANSGEIAMTPTLFIPRSALNTPNPYANDPQSAARGKVVFQENCQVCHGIAGDGNGPAGANLKIRPPTFHNPQHFLAPGMDGAHFWVISHGDGEPGGMPAWDGKLTAQQMWDVLNYIKTIAAGKPA